MEAKLAKLPCFDSAARILAAAVVVAVWPAMRAEAQPVTPDERTAAIQQLAATVGAEQRAVAEEVVRGQRRETRVVYPFGLSGATLSGATLLASQDAKTVAITASFPVAAISELVIKGSAPLSEGAPRSTTLQLDGLVNKSKAGFEWRIGQQRLPTDADMTTLTKGLFEACNATTPSVQRVADSGIEVTGCDLAVLEKDPAVRAFRERYFPRRLAWYLSVKGDIGYETFRFADAATFVDQTTEEYPRSFSAVLGLLTKGNVYVAASGRFEDGFEAARTQAVCSIHALDQKTACPQKIVGPPNPKTAKVTEFEVRKYLSDAGELTIGAAGILRRDWKAENTALEVPLYFLKNKDGGLSGGFSFGYLWAQQPDDTGPRFTVFVGQTFGLGGA